MTEVKGLQKEEEMKGMNKWMGTEKEGQKL